MHNITVGSARLDLSYSTRAPPHPIRKGLVMSAEQNVKINEQVFGRVDALERGVNKGVLMATMGRFLSGNVSDSFRRVQYLFRLYSLPHRAVG